MKAGQTVGLRMTRYNEYYISYFVSIFLHMTYNTFHAFLHLVSCKCTKTRGLLVTYKFDYSRQALPQS